jgi:DNA-binding transcriptional ArsR family regulator/uncharacterized protein YndB with AHSA1/START domain
MDAVFRALADPTRRQLLDLLRESDGQTLTELESRISMTRFGVMKHLKVLAGASLIATRKVGREKLHYLNAVPIQQISDRWISHYAAPFVRAMTHLKTQLEQTETTMSSNKPKQVYEVFIRASAEAIWDALTSGAKTPLYYYGSIVEGDWRSGGRMAYKTANGSIMLDGDVITAEKPHKLVTTFRANWDPSFAADRPSRCTWEITPMGDVCKLTLVHDDFDGETATFAAVGGGWAMILSGLKTLLETGKPMRSKAA